MPIRVLIYEDNAPLREALSVLVDDTDECVLVGAFGDCLRANDQTYQLQPDVVLMDIDMPGRDGIQAVTSIHREFPAVEVLILTVFDDDDRVFRARCAGASGYLLKQTPRPKFKYNKTIHQSNVGHGIRNIHGYSDSGYFRQ